MANHGDTIHPSGFSEIYQLIGEIFQIFFLVQKASTCDDLFAEPLLWVDPMPEVMEIIKNTLPEIHRFCY